MSQPLWGGEATNSCGAPALVGRVWRSKLKDVALASKRPRFRIILPVGYFHRCRISVCCLCLVYGPLPLLPVCVLFHVSGRVHRLSPLLSPGTGQNSATRISVMASGNHAGSTSFLTHLPSILLNRFVNRSATRTLVVEAR
jgi:hypothetical protein